MAQACAFVGHVLFWHDLMPLNLLPSLHPQSKAPHSLAVVHGSPGCLGPGGPASGVLVLLPAQPPCAVQALGQIALVGAHDEPWHDPATAGTFPSLHAQIIGVQSSGPWHDQPPEDAHAVGHVFCPAPEQKPFVHRA